MQILKTYIRHDSDNHDMVAKSTVNLSKLPSDLSCLITSAQVVQTPEDLRTFVSITEKYVV